MKKRDFSDLKLFFALLGWLILPTIYTTVRTAVAGKTGGNLDIFGSMEWFDLIDETIQAFLLTPLYFLLKDVGKRKKFGKYVALSALLVYCAFMVITAFNISKISTFMGQANAASYLTLECLAMIFGFMVSLGILWCTISGWKKAIIFATIAKIFGYAVSDLILIPKFGDLGSAWGDTLVNAVMAALLIGFFFTAEKSATRRTVNFNDLCHFGLTWVRLGLFSGISVLLDNLVYALAVVRIISHVGNMGAYWTANNIIWGFLLQPILAMGLVIQKKKLTKVPKAAWLGVTLTVICWLISYPTWQPFAKYILSSPTANQVQEILTAIMPFYLCYAISAMIDAVFIANGKTWNSLIISLVVNVVYYGIAYLAFVKGIFSASLGNIILMFGLGMTVHMLVSIALYLRMQYVIKKSTIKEVYS